MAPILDSILLLTYVSIWGCREDLRLEFTGGSNSLSPVPTLPVSAVETQSQPIESIDFVLSLCWDRRTHMISLFSKIHRLCDVSSNFKHFWWYLCSPYIVCMCSAATNKWHTKKVATDRSAFQHYLRYGCMWWQDKVFLTSLHLPSKCLMLTGYSSIGLGNRACVFEKQW